MLMFPLLILQGMVVRRTALRLPDADPPASGEFGAGEPVSRLVGLGDSVIAGTGLNHMNESVTAQLAALLSVRMDRRVEWQAEGVNGDALADLLTRLNQGTPLPRADYVLVSIGVNDVTRLTSLLRWQVQLTELVPLIRNTTRAQVILMGLPPMEYFTALPQPLRWVLGLRAAMLDKSLRQVADLLEGVHWVRPEFRLDPQHLAEDGYHPSALACAEIAREIADLVQSPIESAS